MESKRDSRGGSTLEVIAGFLRKAEMRRDLTQKQLLEIIFLKT